MICATTDAAGAIVTAPVQPADMATCAVVLITGDELGAINGITFPDPAHSAEVWSIGFIMVLTSYLIGWGPGAVLRFFRG